MKKIFIICVALLLAALSTAQFITPCAGATVLAETFHCWYEKKSATVCYSLSGGLQDTVYFVTCIAGKKVYFADEPCADLKGLGNQTDSKCEKIHCSGEDGGTVRIKFKWTDKNGKSQEEECDPLCFDCKQKCATPEEKACAGAAPSLTQWGLTILLIVLAGIATWVVLKRKRAFAA